MTKSTDTKNVKKIVRALLSKHGIVDEQGEPILIVEVDLVSAWLRYMFERESGESAGEAKVRVTADFDKVGVILDTVLAGKAMEEFRKRIETALVKSPNWDSAKDDWYEFDRWLYVKDQDGETIEQFMTWWRSDDFRARSEIWLKPSKIKENWPQALAKRTDEKEFTRLL